MVSGPPPRDSAPARTYEGTVARDILYLLKEGVPEEQLQTTLKLGNDLKHPMLGKPYHDKDAPYYRERAAALFEREGITDPKQQELILELGSRSDAHPNDRAYHRQQLEEFRQA